MDFISLQIAWRNIWRNKLRSSVVIMAITVGLFGGLAATGIMKGMVIDMVKNSLENQVSNIQIHKKEFVENKEVGFFMTNTSQIISDIKTDAEVQAVCQRTKVLGMASTASTGTGILMNGIDPKNERLVTQIHNKLVGEHSRYFESDKKNRILISEKLAKKLNAKVKSKIVVSFQDYHGNLTGAAFKVEGIYKTQNGMFDEQNIFVRKADLDKLLGMPENTSHEIAILLYDYKKAKETIAEIQSFAPDYLVQSWNEIDPYLELVSSMTNYMLYIFMSIILLALGFAIVNTMLMVVLERTKELGMIMAIGMNKYKVFQMIMYETTMLTAIGGLVGLIITIAFTTYYGQAGIDISSVGEGFEALGYSSVMHPYLEFLDYLQVVILVITTGIIASIFPTIRAIKMNPAEATRS
ncbi:MAG: ABC transporter permease [Bacteroidales bacterium]|nr:ABC transporter permease [Bacteroidales bacterium]